MRAHAPTGAVAKSGTRHELPDGGLCADRVREVLKLAPKQTHGVARACEINEPKAVTNQRPMVCTLHLQGDHRSRSRSSTSHIARVSGSTEWPGVMLLMSTYAKPMRWQKVSTPTEEIRSFPQPAERSLS
jgi:hypothetical protein